MGPTYADIVSTVALGVAAFSVGWQWWVRTKAPADAVAVSDALKRREYEKNSWPLVRSDAVNVIQMLDQIEDPRFVPKAAHRIRQIEGNWTLVSRFVTGDVAECMAAIDLKAEREWLNAAVAA